MLSFLLLLSLAKDEGKVVESLGKEHVLEELPYQGILLPADLEGVAEHGIFSDVEDLEGQANLGVAGGVQEYLLLECVDDAEPDLLLGLNVRLPLQRESDVV